MGTSSVRGSDLREGRVASRGEELLLASAGLLGEIPVSPDSVSRGCESCVGVRQLLLPKGDSF